MTNEISGITKILLPKVDIIFKLLFGDMRNIDILADFLESVLSLTKDEYEVMTIIDPHLKRERPDDKLSILDVKLTTKTGKIIHIEIQIAEQEEMSERAVYYNAKALVSQIHSGQDYDTLKKTISIIITDFNIIKSSPRYHHVFQLYDIKSGARFSDIIEINTLELSKVASQPDNTKKYEWLQFLNAESEEEFQMIAEKNPVIKKAFVELKRLSQDEEAQLFYEAREKAIRDENSRLKSAIRKGMTEGRLEGRLEGKIEGKIEIAAEMLKDGLDIAKVSMYTGLPVEEINKLSLSK